MGSVGDDTGMAVDALTTARAALAVADARIAAADRQLADAIRTAHRVAVDSISRLEAVRSDIDAAVVRQRTDIAAGAREFGRFLLDRNRDIAAILEQAQSEAAAGTAALRTLIGEYPR